MSVTWTIAQAAMILEKPTQLLQKAVERTPVKPSLVQRGRRRIYILEMRDLVFFCAFDEMKDGITMSKRVELYEALKGLPAQAAIKSVEVGPFSYDFAPYARRVATRIKVAEKLIKLVDSSGAEPVVKGTDINVYRIAALLEGMTVDEILRDYPSLTRQQVIAAKAYADSQRKAGRPYPSITAKKAMLEARADASEFLPTRR